MRWTVVIPVKALPAAKSRLLPASTDAAAHRRLVEAIRDDTIAAATAAAGVARVLLVADIGPPADDRIVQTSPGLNGALRDAAAHASEQWPADGIAALVGDLPALRPGELAEALAAVGDTGGFVPDADGTGTTLLATPPGRPLEPRFGTDSAARHALSRPALPAGPGLRRDVDTADELHRAATDPGVGPATAAVLQSAADLRSPSLGMICR